MADHFWKLVLLPWFGHGRMSECSLAVTCFLATVILLIFPQQAFDTTALADLSWKFSPRYLALPFAVKAALTGLGLALNVAGYPISKWLRFTGALVGFAIWSWLSLKFTFLQTFLFGWVFTIPNAYLSIRIMAFALVDMPPPGAPGRHV